MTYISGQSNLVFLFFPAATLTLLLFQLFWGTLRALGRMRKQSLKSPNFHEYKPTSLQVHSMHETYRLRFIRPLFSRRDLLGWIARYAPLWLVHE